MDPIHTRFIVRTTRQLHARAKAIAAIRGLSLEAFVTELVDEHLKNAPEFKNVAQGAKS